MAQYNLRFTRILPHNGHCLVGFSHSLKGNQQFPTLFADYDNLIIRNSLTLFGYHVLRPGAIKIDD